MSSERTSKGDIDQLTQDVSYMNLDPGQDGDWEELAKKNKTTAGKLWGPQSVAPKMAGSLHALIESHNISLPLQPPLQDGWNAADRVSSSQMKAAHDSSKENDGTLDTAADVEDGDDTDSFSDDDDDDFLSDGVDSDESQCSHEKRKKHRMLKVFFESLDKLTSDEIKSPVRQWHCPVCQGGPGAIFWYRGLYTLVTHARTKGSIRPRLHRHFAELLEQELCRKGISVVPAGESFSHWEGLGLGKEGKDHDIVWPAMVMITNTRLDKGDDDKWRGMGNQELLDYFSSYAVVKARHSYGPEGHRGISLLIFERSAVGFLEAERLHRHFLEQGTGREAWEQSCELLYHGGRRKLYGYLATKDDVEVFNQHIRGKQRIKYEMRSYHEMVGSQLKQMSEDNLQLTWFKHMFAKEKSHSKTVEESLNFMIEKLRQTLDEDQIVKLKSRIHHEQNQEEMNFQDQFFREQMRQIQEAVNGKEERKKVEELSSHALSVENHKRRMEEIDHLIKLQDHEMLQFVLERDELLKIHEEKKDACKRRCLGELVELEKGLSAALTLLMEKYAPGSTRGDASSASTL